MGNLEATVTLLGLRQPVRTALDMRPLIRKGFAYSAIERVARALELSVDETASVIGLAPRTMARRKAERTLGSLESERVLRVASTFARAVDVLGDEEKARRWITKPNRSLVGISPLAMLDTEIGNRAVEDALTRIEYGIPS